MSANMDQFVNWDHAAVSQAEEPAPESTLAPQPTNDSNPNAPSQDIDPSLLGMMPAMNPSLDNIGLTFENIDEDDFSFFALQHFASGNPDVMTASQPDATAAAAAPLATAVNYNNDNTQNNNLNDGNAWPQFAGTTTTSAASSAPSSNPMLSMAGELLPTGHSDGSNRSSLVDLNNLGLSSSRSMTPAGAGTGSTAATDAHPGVLPPKVGARFSRESVRILKDWLTTHNRHPYPSDEEKELLQRKTGLNKTQITNWLANARRRGKVHPPPRSTSPHPGIWAPGSIDIPQRRGTPAMESMNPLQRWEHSPPENEPASVSAIARAVTASSSAGSSAGLHSSVHSNWLADDGSGRSLCNQSSASSLGTSHSNSESSAYSYNSHNSLGSFGSGPFSNSRSRRRRRRKTSHSIGNKRSGSGDGAAGRTELRPPAKTFQCTFCTETFRTKHDWQRHEKSLHLSLERWVCAPHGSKAVNPETGQLSCVYCGLANPDTAHIESHNHSTCQDRHPGERTFYRKDHLNQHLRLVHNVKFMDWSMKSWKVATPEICARCGFCGIRTDSWAMRVDHLAEHFKAGSSMADWRGDWGFDTPVLEMVENSIPPCMRPLAYPIDKLPTASIF